MSWSALRRARRLGESPSLWRLVLVLSILSALFVPLLIIDLGLVMHLLVHRGFSQPPDDWILGPLISFWLADAALLEPLEVALVVMVAVGAVLAALEALTLWLLNRAVQRLAARVTTRVRAAVHDQAFSLGTHDLLGTARSSPEQLFTDQSEQLRRGLAAWYRATPRSGFQLALLLLLAVAINFWLALFATLMSICILRMYRGLKRAADRRHQHWRQLRTRQEAKLLRILSLAPMTTGYGLEEPPGEPFEQGLREFERVEVRAETSSSSVQPLMLLTILLAAGFLLLVVGLRPDLTVSGTIVLGAALICASYPARLLFGLRTPLDEAERAASQIFTYLDRDTGVGQIADARPLDRLRESLSLERITLADRNAHRLLNQVSLQIPAGKRVAVLASDPQTPIALAGLFVRFYDPAAGRILYDDHDIRHATLDTIRGQALLVAGHGPLFPGTIAENIACGDQGFTTLQIADAARRAHAYDFVQALPQQFATRVGDEPPLLAGHQAFRVGLARALVREPSLLVIEEPPGHFDEQTLRELETAIQQASEKRTVIVLPSLLSTLRTAEIVYLFHEGKLEATGKHADLLQNNELYRHVNYVRFNAIRQKIKW